ncbi:hypothetical protein DIPPA_08073 [Diplonema papillatum]|nr:hypothetical protein DIPPA_08073 [Diplonema papillatum]
MVNGDPCNRNQYMGQKPSTRVHAAPGGNSSLSLRWDDAPQATPPRPQRELPPWLQPESQAQPMQGRQRQAQQMQGQPMQNQQMQNQQGRPQQMVAQPMAPHDGHRAHGGHAIPPAAAAPPASQPPQRAQQPAGRGLSSNAWASNANQNCGNMITDRPTTRIHAPPGGKSSITF